MTLLDAWNSNQKPEKKVPIMPQDSKVQCFLLSIMRTIKCLCWVTTKDEHAFYIWEHSSLSGQWPNGEDCNLTVRRSSIFREFLIFSLFNVKEWQKKSLTCKTSFMTMQAKEIIVWCLKSIQVECWLWRDRARFGPEKPSWDQLLIAGGDSDYLQGTRGYTGNGTGHISTSLSLHSFFFGCASVLPPST